MLNRHELEDRALALDACIDRLVSGDDWQAALPSDEEARRDMIGLVAVARRLVEVASLVPSPTAAEMRQRVWRRVSAAAPELRQHRNLFRRLSPLKVLYTPPPNPGLLHRVLFARVPGVPPLIVRYAEAS